MTYCVGLRLDKGILFMSDTRTNAGVDDISVVKKLKTWHIDGDRVITLLSSGNLATTQSVTSILEERMLAPEDRDPSILQATTMFQIAQIVGNTLRDVISKNSQTGPTADSKFGATLILGGQIKGMPPKLFLIYPEGNFIECSDETPYFQIGETKYGRPILVRGHDSKMSFEDAVKLLLVSFDSTMKANLSVGLPLDLQIYETDTLKVGYTHRFERHDPYFQHISTGWGEALKNAFHALPNFKF